MPGLAVDDSLTFGAVLGVAGREGNLPPVDPAHLGLRRVPRVVGVGEAHPAEPVLVCPERVQPGDRPVGDPVGVVDPAGDGVGLDLGGAGVPAAGPVDLQRPVEDRVEPAHGIGMLGGQPLRIVQGADSAVGGQLQVFEPAVQPAGRLGAGVAERVLGEAEERVEERLEVGLADQRGPVAGPVQHVGDRRRVEGQGDPVHPHAVGGRVLAGQDGGAGGHAHHRLGVDPLEADSLSGQPVDDRGTGEGPAIAAEGVIALLVGGDEEDLAAHRRAPFKRPARPSRGRRVGQEAGASFPRKVGRYASAARAAPPITSARAAGSASVP